MSACKLRWVRARTQYACMRMYYLCVCLILVLGIHTDSPALSVGVQIEVARRTHAEEGGREERERITKVMKANQHCLTIWKEMSKHS